MEENKRVRGISLTKLKFRSWQKKEKIELIIFKFYVDDDTIGPNAFFPQKK